MTRTIIATIVTLWLSLCAAVACAEPAQFEYEEGETRVYLDIYNRSYLAVEEVETLIVFYDATGRECHRDLVYIDFETPIPAQDHEEIYVTLPDLSPFRPVRAEVQYTY